jgi:Flp pilus assembly protein TadD
VLLALGLACAWRTLVWGDGVRLWREAVQEVPRSSRAWNNLGMAYVARHDSAAARAAFEQALRIDPRYAKALGNLNLIDVLQ